MHGFVKKGLLLSLAAGSMMVSGAGVAAAADSAGTEGVAADSPGLAAGNVAQGAGDVPVQVCGDAGGAGAALQDVLDNRCTTWDNHASIRGAAADDPGAVSGDVVGGALDAPVQGCGLTGAVAGVRTEAEGNSCDDVHTSATAVGATADDPGAVSGDVVQASVNAPIQACGDAFVVGAFGTGADDNRCVNS
ncbi:chaplin [Catenulispora sp. NL8]|uniref:Chaplin n=1 Tax=Catenulispora pinistramenti TaxID=2705254 RepID=A0ABS5KHF8_9ACTN|nr:chaplin [Catenulispora pinistramenti]MBS2545663.1 chaplin [Catenulispora pinistramenti]